MREPLTPAGERARQDRLDEATLQKEIDKTIEEYRLHNRQYFNAAEVNDMRLHYRAINGLPQFLQMVQEEIQLIKRHGPRAAPWWDLVD